MGKIFEISGNVRENGEWIQPEPSFRGEIALCDDGHIRGYCDEAHEAKEPRRYIYGKFGKSKRSKKDGLVFFKLTKTDSVPTLLFVINDLDGNSDNEWAEMHGLGYRPKDEAKIVLEEIEYSQEKYDEIVAQFKELGIRDCIVGSEKEAYIAIFDRFSDYYFE